MPRLEGKIALITGAASGIGAATAALFAAEGAGGLVLTDLRPAALAPVATPLGERAMALAHDVTREEDWRRVVDETVVRFGRLDVLVNCAGIALPGDIEQTTLEDWRATQAVNSDGVFLGCREAVRVMKEGGRGGAIVNISSVAGMIGDPKLAAYCASKGAARLLTKSVALHCARRRYGIRCNSVHPSFAATPMLEAMIARSRSPERTREGLTHASPLGRMAAPEEIAAAILFLASDESAFITGAELAVDGGLTAA
jgi:NAD(P)-dependent dehydrogenase (short-subunit alcohol dehydrogenase family)